VCLLGHDEAGSIGVVINRPSDTPVDEILPQWVALTAQPRRVFIGGPVQTDGALCVARITDAEANPFAGPTPAFGRDLGLAGHPAGQRRTSVPDDAGAGNGDERDELDLGEVTGFRPVVGALGTVNLERSPDEVKVDLVEARVFAGYAGWGPGQLETEVLSGDWFVFQLDEQDVFDAEPEDLWARILRRQGGWLAVLARYPLDASVN
jgi:putative transcriptional regulator